MRKRERVGGSSLNSCTCGLVPYPNQFYVFAIDYTDLPGCVPSLTARKWVASLCGLGE
jgi:hypothetical protein